MYTRTTSVFMVAALTVLTAGCIGAEKSANPLSPTVAGPIPGVNITTPNPVQPVSSRIAADQQPVTLTVKNAETNGVRPVSYLFEIATDPAFTNKVFTQSGVTPAASGQTSLKLPDQLVAGQTYFWRAKAQDGANASDYSSPVSFYVYIPIVIQAPRLVSPTGNDTTDSLTPRFSVADAPRSGPVGSIVYQIEVADSDSFANKLATWTVAEQSGGVTSVEATTPFPANTQLFWHARASDPTTSGPFSAAAVFKTPAASPPPSSGGGGSGGGGASGNYASLDQINLSAAHIVGGGPADIGSWSVTTPIQRIDFSASSGLLFTFPAADTWPDQPIPGWNGGTLQYTVWACAPVNGWTCAGFIQMWKGRGYTGAPLPSQYTYWWGSGGSVTGGLFGSYVPQPGDTMAFFVAAGNERADSYSSIHERSNVVLVTLPAGDSGSFSY